MDELAELQALLGAVQKQEVKYRLNERNCKELLIKLIEKGLVELIVTLVGHPPPPCCFQQFPRMFGVHASILSECWMKAIAQVIKAKF
jgi:hypothetical protein